MGISGISSNKKSGQGGDVTDIISKLVAQTQKLNVPDARKDAILQARRLISALETPMETLLRIEWVEPTTFTAIRLAIDLKLFETLAAESGRDKTISELCVPKSADPALVIRLVRHLAATGFVCEQTGTGTYTPNAMSKALATPEYSSGIRVCFDSTTCAYAHMPSFFEKTGYKNPTGATDGPFQHAHGPGHAFAWFNQRPELLKDLNTYLFAQRSERPSWTADGFYPIHEHLVQGMDIKGDRSVLVDVGGGAGFYLEEFRTKVPEWKGRLVLQEQETIVEQIKSMILNPRIECQSYDFFTEQPIKGARAYFLRDILHDWPDDRCREILTNLKNAMEPGYSKLLLNECVVADEQPALQHTTIDLMMMAMAAGQERTESQWRKLISSVGLRVIGIWTQGVGNESIIEIVQ